MHFQPEAQLCHFHLEKVTSIVLKLHMLPSGNKILNFASFQASYSPSEAVQNPLGFYGQKTFRNGKDLFNYISFAHAQMLPFLKLLP